MVPKEGEVGQKAINEEMMEMFNINEERLNGVYNDMMDYQNIYQRYDQME
jgi:hypothetical protein